MTNSLVKRNTMIELDDGPLKECPQCGEDGVLTYIFPGQGLEWEVPKAGTLCVTFDEGEALRWLAQHEVSVLEQDVEGIWGPKTPMDVEAYYHPDDDGDDDQ